MGSRGEMSAGSYARSLERRSVASPPGRQVELDDRRGPSRVAAPRNTTRSAVDRDAGRSRCTAGRLGRGRPSGAIRYSRSRPPLRPTARIEPSSRKRVVREAELPVRVARTRPRPVGDALGAAVRASGRGSSSPSGSATKWRTPSGDQRGWAIQSVGAAGDDPRARRAGRPRRRRRATQLRAVPRQVRVVPREPGERACRPARGAAPRRSPAPSARTVDLAVARSIATSAFSASPWRASVSGSWSSRMARSRLRGAVEDRGRRSATRRVRRERLELARARRPGGAGRSRSRRRRRGRRRRGTRRRRTRGPGQRALKPSGVRRVGRAVRRRAGRGPGGRPRPAGPRATSATAVARAGSRRGRRARREAARSANGDAQAPYGATVSPSAPRHAVRSRAATTRRTPSARRSSSSSVIPSAASFSRATSASIASGTT